jgi:hypothetical protein
MIAEPIFHVLLCSIDVYVEQTFIYLFLNRGGSALCRGKTSIGNLGKRSLSL